MKSRILVYGVEGFMGALTSRAAMRAGLSHVAAGRNIAPVAQHAAALAREGGALAEPRTFSLGKAGRIATQLDDIAVLVNCADLGDDDLHTLLDACMATGTHYLDLAGDRGRVAALVARDDEARERKIMVMAGAGFDFAAAAAVGARLAHILPGARAVTLAVKRSALTAGEAKRLVAALREPGETVKNGQFVPAGAGEKTIEVDFDNGPETAWLAPWRGEAMAARHRGGYSTIESYEVLPEAAARALEPGTWAHRFFRRGWGLKRLERKLARGRLSPTSEDLKRGRAVIWGEARTPDGITRRARLETPAPHLYSAAAAILLAQRATMEDVKTGFQLPSAIGGAALVEDIPGVVWREIVEVDPSVEAEADRPVALDMQAGGV
ncbi:Saccharopine dehydrogenase [Parvibaculum lavamentivorans DS-1]|uniref:Saccharopine dehydrogenase n=2 Tax=Parvibaculum lavamentivorans TaxID=256618 RepID=A7HRF4_PARL1|nr:Saccharopine dehydrogenase [Parvibaculum lavamentivorans DS-1]